MTDFLKNQKGRNMSKHTDWTRWHKPVEDSMRGNAIKRAIFNLREIRENIHNLVKYGPIVIGTKASTYQGRNHDSAEEAWKQKVLQLSSQFEDDIVSATIAYEDAMYFPTETNEEEK